MFAPLRFSVSVALAAISCANLVACTSVSSTRGFSTMLTPYKIDRVQGNVITSEQLSAIKVGMSKATVKDILGTPLLSSVFHADRWDYVFTLKRQGVEPQVRRVAVFFKGDTLTKVEADALPTEAQFVASLKSDAKIDNLPPLVASEESLKKFPPSPPATTEPVPLAAPSNYPPLEPVGR